MDLSAISLRPLKVAFLKYQNLRIRFLIAVEKSPSITTLMSPLSWEMIMKTIRILFANKKKTNRNLLHLKKLKFRVSKPN